MSLLDDPDTRRCLAFFDGSDPTLDALRCCYGTEAEEPLSSARVEVVVARTGGGAALTPSSGDDARAFSEAEEAAYRAFSTYL